MDDATNAQKSAGITSQLDGAVADSGKNESVSQVYEPMAQRGGGTLRRPGTDLALSGLIAGLDIGFGPLAMGVVAGRLHLQFGLPLKEAIFYGGFLYPLGFVLVIMGKSELFTENTLSPVAGLLRGKGSLTNLARSWGLILGANIAGTVLFSLFASHVDVVFAPYHAVFQEMGRSLTTQPFLQAMLAAIFGGWLVALIGWMIETTKGSGVHFVLIYVIAYLLTGLSLYHSVIGSIEVLMAMFAGAPITWTTWATGFLAPAILGNILGGVFFVAGLKGFQAALASDDI